MVRVPHKQLCSQSWRNSERGSQRVGGSNKRKRNKYQGAGLRLGHSDPRLLEDTRKSGSLLGERPSPGVHSAVSLGVLSPMWLLRTFSAMVDSIGRVPANVGGDASSPETLLLTPHKTTILNTQPPPQKRKKNQKLFIFQFLISTLCPKIIGSLLFCSLLL